MMTDTSGSGVGSGWTTRVQCGMTGAWAMVAPGLFRATKSAIAIRLLRTQRSWSAAEKVRSTALRRQ